MYPASAQDAPDDAVVRTPGQWGAGAGGKEGGTSELHFTEEELRAARESSEPSESARSSEEQPEA
ncbi:hypothetical protein D3C83_223500 [compost metagenome]